MSLPSPDKCLLYADVSKGYIIQYLAASLAKMQHTRIHMNVGKEGIQFQTEKIVLKNQTPVSAALLDAFLDYDKFDRFVFTPESAITIEMNGKHFADQLKKFKRKERVVLYILNTGKKHADEMRIYAESTVEKAVMVGVEHNITVSVYDKLIPFKPTDDIEVYTDKKTGVETQIYDTCVNVDSSHFDRAKNIGGTGDFATTIQGSTSYILFEKTNKKMFSGKVRIGVMDPKKPTYYGVFDANIFNIIMILAKIKTPIVFYPPKLPGYPLKIAVSLEYVGECRLYIKTNNQMEHEMKQPS